MKTSIALLLSLFACVSFAEDDSLFQLMNYYEYSDKLMSAGQPLPEQFPSIAAAGIGNGHQSCSSGLPHRRG